MDTVMSWQPLYVSASPNRTTVPGMPEKSEGADLIGVLPESENMMEWTDEELMRSTGDGHVKAFETLYDRHVRGCFGLAMRVVRDSLVAEEVVQDVFMKVWSAPQSFVPGRGKFSSWLLTLVHNRSVDRLRRARTQQNYNPVSLDASTDDMSIAEIVADKAPGPEEQVWREEQGSIVRGFLSTLSEPQRQALTMAYMDGLTQKEISEKLMEPLGTVKTRTRAALMQMRTMMNGQNLMGDL